MPELPPMRQALATLLTASLLAGCGSSAFEQSGAASGSPELTGRDVVGYVRLSPTKPVAQAQVVLMGPQGERLATTTTDGNGAFSLGIDDPLPPEIEIQATAGDDIVLRSREENTDGVLVVDLLTTVVANWHERNPGQPLRDSAEQIMDFLLIPHEVGAEAASDNSFHADFDPDVFLERAEAEGGIQPLIDSQLGRLEQDPLAVSAFVSDPRTGNLDFQSLAAMKENLAGPGLTNDATPSPRAQLTAFPIGSFLSPFAAFAFNWVASAAGLNSTTNTVLEIAAAVQDLRETVDIIDRQLQLLLQALNRGFYNQAAAELNVPESKIDFQELEFSQVLASGSLESLETYQNDRAVSAATLREQLGLLFQSLNVNGAGSRGLLQEYLLKVSATNNTITQSQFDGMAFLVARERGYIVRGLQVLLERAHQRFDDDMLFEAALDFDREMLRLKLNENEVIKQLEFTGSKNPSGRSHQDLGILAKSMPGEILTSLVKNGLQAPGFETTLTQSYGPGAKVLNVTNPAGIQPGNVMVIDTRTSQETVIVAEVKGTAITLASPTSKAHSSSSAPVRGANGSAITSPNVLWDKDADLAWLLPAVNHFERGALGRIESGLSGWVVPNTKDLTHLFEHLSSRDIGKLSELGFRNFDGRSLWMAVSLESVPQEIVGIFKAMTGEFFILPPNLRNEGAFSPEAVRTYLPQQVLVRKPTAWLKSLKVSLAPLPNSEIILPPEAALGFPESTLTLRLEAQLNTPFEGQQTFDITRLATWTVKSGPFIVDPLEGRLGTFKQARVRVSNAPGTEGLVEFRSLPGDTGTTAAETYLIQAQFGSNIAEYTVRFGGGSFIAQPKDAPQYVSHVMVQDHCVIPHADGDRIRLRAFGRFTPDDLERLRPKFGTAASGGPDFGRPITSDSRLTWSVEPANAPASISVSDGVAVLSVRRPVPPEHRIITVKSTWTGATKAADPGYPRVKTTRARVKILQ